MNETTEEIYLAALCARCAMPKRGRTDGNVPIIKRPDGWAHLGEPRGRKHAPEPLAGTVAPADVWDCDDAAARRLGNPPNGPSP